MTRLYLHLNKGDVRIEDPDGAEFASLSDARQEAVGSIRQIMSDMILSGRRPGHGSIDITDRHGAVLLSVRFEEALDHA